MKQIISLHGALREADPSGKIELDVPEASTIADLRLALIAHAHEHALPVSEGVIRRSAFATAETIMHDHQTLPAGTELAILPPVSGG